MTEPIVVIFLTYDHNGSRTEYALRTIRAAKKYLHYPELLWYLADDGSRQEHIDAVKAELNGSPGIGWHTLPGGTYGANANKATEEAQKHADLTFWLEDDWELLQPLNLWGYADMLLGRTDIGMVRLGHLQHSIRGETFGYNGHLYWLLDRGSREAHVFAGHPSLRHCRFHQAYGPYVEGLRPGETELAMAWQFRTREGPEIVWPAEVGCWGYFGHIGMVQSYE